MHQKSGGIDQEADGVRSALGHHCLRTREMTRKDKSKENPGLLQGWSSSYFLFFIVGTPGGRF
jgi:hypothetical protein